MAMLLPRTITALTIYRNYISRPQTTMEMVLPSTIYCTFLLPQLHHLTSSNHGNAPSQHHPPLTIYRNAIT